MSNSNNGSRLTQLENLVLSLAQSVNQANQQQQAINAQFSARLSEFIEISNENFRVAQQERAELRQSQRETAEAVRSIAESVDRLSDEVIPLIAGQQSQDAERLSRLEEGQASVNATIERMDRILDYLVRRGKRSYAAGLSQSR